MQAEIKLRKISDIKTAPPFDWIFNKSLNLIEAIAQAMHENGYDTAYPIVVWKERRGVILDGNTRYHAACVAGIRDIPVLEKSFDSEDAALAYAIAAQKNRRNLTDDELVRAVIELEKRHPRRQSSDLTDKNNPSGKSATRTAEVLGTSTRTVERVRTLQKHGTPADVAAVVSGDLSLNAALSKIRTQKGTRNPRVSANSCAEKAIDWLSKIAIDDVDRASAFERVAQWISEQLHAEQTSMQNNEGE